MLLKHMKSKKGESLSMNTIVIAAIALTVLIVMIIIFTGKTKDFVIGTKSCEAKKGSCTPLLDCKNNDGIIHRNTNCKDNNPEELESSNDNFQVCCVDIM
jgi:hypothetical protein